MEDEDSIPSAKKYYDEFRMKSPEIVEEREEYQSRSLITTTRDSSLEIVEEREEYHSRSPITSTRDSSLEIVEVGDEYHSNSITSSSSRDHVESNDDVYIAVGRDDSDVVKWALQHVLSPGSLVYLVHVYPPITYIPTPGE